MNFHIEDIELKTLANLPITYHGVELYPKKIIDIAKDGYHYFNANLGMALLSKSSLEKELDLPEALLDKPLLLIALIKQDYEFIEQYISAFNYFANNSIKWSPSAAKGIDFENPEIQLEDFEVFAHILKIQNRVVLKADGEEYNVVSERAKKLKERILARRKQIAEMKTAEGEGSLSFNDLVSILSSNANGINIINVWDLNYFQFNDQFNRMKMIDEYHTNIQALLHGADAEKINLKHWMTKPE